MMNGEHQPSLELRPELLPQSAIDELLGLLEELPATDQPIDAAALDQAVARAVSASAAVLSVPATAARDLESNLRALLGLSPKEQASQLAEAGFQSLSSCRYLIRAARRHAQDDLATGAEIAELGVLVAENLDPEALGLAVYHDVLAEAWATVGSLRRSQLEFESSRRAFERAEDFLCRGSGCLLTRAEVQAQWASLNRDQQDFTEATRRLDEAIRIYRAAGVPKQLSRALISRGMLHFEQGQPLAASADFEAAIELFAGDESGEQALAAHANLAQCYCQLELYGDAWQQLRLARRLAERLRAGLATIRLQWLEARLHQAAGSAELAEIAYEVALTGFIERELWGDAAILGLDLAILYAEQGRHAELRRLGRAMGPILEAKKLRRSTLSALLVLVRAVEQDTVSVSLLREIRQQAAVRV